MLAALEPAQRQLLLMKAELKASPAELLGLDLFDDLWLQFARVWTSAMNLPCLPPALVAMPLLEFWEVAAEDVPEGLPLTAAAIGIIP